MKRQIEKINRETERDRVLESKKEREGEREKREREQNRKKEREQNINRERERQRENVCKRVKNKERERERESIEKKEREREREKMDELLDLFAAENINWQFIFGERNSLKLGNHLHLVQMDQLPKYTYKRCPKKIHKIVFSNG